MIYNINFFKKLKFELKTNLKREIKRFTINHIIKEFNLRTISIEITSYEFKKKQLF